MAIDRGECPYCDEAIEGSNARGPFLICGAIVGASGTLRSNPLNPNMTCKACRYNNTSTVLIDGQLYTKDNPIVLERDFMAQQAQHLAKGLGYDKQHVELVLDEIDAAGGEALDRNTRGAKEFLATILLKGVEYGLSPTDAEEIATKKGLVESESISFEG